MKRLIKPLKSKCCKATVEAWSYDKYYCSNCHKTIEKQKNSLLKLHLKTSQRFSGGFFKNNSAIPKIVPDEANTGRK